MEPSDPKLEQPAEESGSLAQRSIKGISWTLMENICLFGINFLVGAVLANLLQPEQFGLVAIVLLITQFSTTLLDSGFSSALIQKRETTHIEESSVFFLNLVLGVLFSMALAGVSFWLAEFYNEPELRLLTIAISPIIALRSLTLVQTALLTRDLNFKPIATATITGAITGGVAGLFLAASGFGAWALVIQQLATVIVLVVLLWIGSKWRPAFSFSFAALRSLFGFGSRLCITALLESLFHNIHAVMIGRVFSSSDLGLYARGKQTALVPAHMISSVLSRVTFPLMSEINTDNSRFTLVLRRSISSMAFLSLPLSIGLALIAEPFTRILFGSHWLGAVPVTQMLCLTSAFFPIQVLQTNAIKALGRSDLLLRVEIVKKIVLLTSLLCLLPFGFLAVVAGQAAFTVVSFLFNGYYLREQLGYSFGTQIRDILPQIACTSFMAVGAFSISLLSFENDFVLTFLQILVGMVTYVLISSFLQRETFVHYLNLLPIKQLSQRFRRYSI